jgi:ParB family chromosome partitioning protein
MAEPGNSKRGLGRGLSALMADVRPEPSAESVAPRGRPADQQVPIEQVHPNPDQPRRRFDPEELDSLAASIREKGIVQPLIVRPAAGGYQIVAGERRWRAAQMAKLHRVPVIVRDYSDLEVLEIAIIENIQRADLNPIEEASGYRQLMERFGHTQEKLAEALGKSRSHIANSVRLLQLPETVQEMLQAGELSAGHARALITAEDPAALAREVVRKGLSVRETEKLAQAPRRKAAARPGKPAEKDADTRALELDLGAALGMKVSIDHSAGSESGRLTISYGNLDELDDLCRKLSIA